VANTSVSKFTNTVYSTSEDGDYQWILMHLLWSIKFYDSYFKQVLWILGASDVRFVFRNKQVNMKTQAQNAFYEKIEQNENKKVISNENK